MSTFDVLAKKCFAFFEKHATAIDTLCWKKLSFVCMAQIPLGSTRLDSTRLDTFDFVEQVEQVETSETSRALPTCRTTNDLVQV